ncbi:MAG: MFS transporter [Paracoccaceae bacterium]
MKPAVSLPVSLPVSLLAAYALPAFALAALYLPLYTYLTPFYVGQRGVDLAALGIVLIAIRLFDAVSDPAMGWLSDRTPARWGRRRTWLILSVPVICFAAWQLFVPPEGAGLAHAALWLTVVTLGWTMAQTPYAAWGAEIAPDYDSRSRVTGWRETVVLIGTVAVTIVYVGASDGGDTDDPAAGLTAVAWMIAIALPLGVLATVIRVPDRLPAKAPRRLSIAEGLATMRANRPFLWLLGAWILNGLANGLPVTLFVFYTQDRLGMDTETFGIMFILYFASAVLGIPFWLWMAKRLSKHRAWCIAMLWACAVFACVLFLQEGDIVAFGVVSVLTGLAFGADLALPPAIQADVVDLDTRQTGAARAGAFFAVWQVATKASLAIASGTALIALDIAGFVTGTPNDPAALWTLTLLYAGAPIVLKLAAIALMWRFPLDRTYLTPPEARVA